MQIRWICSNTSWNLEIIPPYSMNKIALNKRSLHNYTPYLPHSWSHAVPALPEQNSMLIGWGNLGDLSYWLKIPQICCCYIWGCLEPRWGRKVPQLIPQNFAESDSSQFLLHTWMLMHKLLGFYFEHICHSRRKKQFNNERIVNEAAAAAIALMSWTTTIIRTSTATSYSLAFILHLNLSMKTFI